MKILLTLIALLMLVPTTGFAQQTLIDKGRYPAGSSVKNAYLGVGLSIPKGAVAAYSEQNGVQLLVVEANDGGKMAVLVLFQRGVGAQTYKNAFSQALPIDRVKLEPQDPPRTQGNLVSVHSADFSQGVVGQQLAVLGQTGSSLLLIGVAPQGLEAPLTKLLAALVGSIKFSQGLVANSDAKTRNAWTAQLAGKTLSSSTSSSSGSGNGFASAGADTTLGLCHNQRYEYSTHSFASVSVEGLDASSLGGGDENSSGQWAIEYVNANGLIVVLTENGLQRRVALGIRGDNLTLNGQTVSVAANGC